MTPRAIWELSKILNIEENPQLVSKAQHFIVGLDRRESLFNKEYFELRLMFLEWLEPSFRHLRILTGGLLHEDKLASELNMIRKMKRREELWNGLSWFKRSTRD